MHIFSGRHKNKRIIAPKGDLTRPTSGRLRETIFNICQGYIEGANFLDLFAGSGAIGLEALSRGAASSTFVDNSRESLLSIKANLKAFGEEKSSKVIFGDVFEVLKNLIKTGQKFEIIFADPPYEKHGKDESGKFNYSSKILEIVDSSGLLKEGGYLFIEDARTFTPEVHALTGLTFVSSRSTGRSSLNQFVNKSTGVGEAPK
jgi:16S rRNA (guanine(966)-N(2))-methyltransferase RsmD